MSDYSAHQQRIDKKLQEAGNGLLKLRDESKLPMGVQRILANFDHWQGTALAQESRTLAEGGVTSSARMEIPAGFQRTIVREALSDLAVLDFVEIHSNPSAQATMMIPYETREGVGFLNGGVVYENNPIPRVGITQSMWTAYIRPCKISLLVSNEIQHFTSALGTEFAALERNIASNSGIIRESIGRRIANEMQRAADSYNAVSVSSENIASQCDGETSLIKTAHFPIVRPHQERNLQGIAVGDPENPLVLTINATPIAEWNGTGTQPAGIYYQLESLNLGLIRLVDSTGQPVTPTASGACTLSYSYATNVALFDLKPAAGVEEYVHLDGALKALGQARAMLLDQRWVRVDYALMSPTLNVLLSGARGFMQTKIRFGTALDGRGDLDVIHGIPCYATNARCDLGAERIILGERGTVRYVVAKPFMTGMPFEAQGPNGPIGAKIAYGEEYSAICVPAPIRKNLTSVILYHSDARAAAV